MGSASCTTCHHVVSKITSVVDNKVVGVLKKDGCSPFCHKAEVHPFEAAALCGLCESVVIKAHDKASSKDFKADVSALAGRQCDALGSGLKAECLAIVAISLPVAEQKLVDFLSDEKAVCTSAHLCD